MVEIDMPMAIRPDHGCPRVDTEDLYANPSALVQAVTWHCSINSTIICKVHLVRVCVLCILSKWMLNHSKCYPDKETNRTAAARLFALSTDIQEHKITRCSKQYVPVWCMLINSCLLIARGMFYGGQQTVQKILLQRLFTHAFACHPISTSSTIRHWKK